MILAVLLLALLVSAAVHLSLRYRWWRPAIPLAHPRILMYHMVREPIAGARFNGLRVRPADFERQLRWLSDHGWQFHFLSDVLAEDAAIPAKTVVLTFDDGYEDNFTEALPVMRRYGAKGTLFLVKDRFDNDWSVKKKAHHSEGELAREPKLSDEQVRELLASGCFELGGHSLTHADFSKLDSDQKRREIFDSKRALEQDFGVSLASYAYTFGIYDSEDVALVREAGYLGAVTTREGIDRDLDACRYELSRVKVSGRKNFLFFRLSLRAGVSSLF
jgi:peptidoglycan/xylan/chitin deacetylase (PgdA/CDA1 family)